MSRSSDVQNFINEANRVTEVSQLKDLLDGIVRSMGFHYFALVHHVDIHALPSDSVQMIEYPPHWAEMMMAHDYFAEDPVAAACQKVANGFEWTNVGNIISLTTRQKDILTSAKTVGLGDGFTIPVHIPGEYAGSCSFSVQWGKEFQQEAMPALQYVGLFSFEAARRIYKTSDPGYSRTSMSATPPALTGRQLDCVVLAARGKSDWDMAQLLGISRDTVHQHLEEAKRRYGVHSRVQLIVRALFDSRLTFADLVGR